MAGRFTLLSKPGLLLRIAASCLMLAVIVWTVWPLLPFGRNRRPETIVLYGFSIIEPAITRSVFPAFQKKWMAQTGIEVELIGSFAGSGTVTNQLIMGVPAELAILSTELDADRLREAGTIPGETWKMLPHGGVINRTPFVILVRPGNPKKIHDFADLARPGIRVVHQDPSTSGAANWAIIAEYGSAVRQPGAGPDAGKSILLGIWRNVVAQAGSGRAARTQFDNGFGDTLITYEQDALWSRAHGSPPFEIIYPRSTILSEHTLVVMEHNSSRKQKELVQAFVDFLWTEEAQRLFVMNGFRSVDESLNAANGLFGHITDPFFIGDFGGWKQAQQTIIDATWKNQVLKELRP
jgi:sulfate/thiosulfate transport system substrate-binding protein